MSAHKKQPNGLLSQQKMFRSAVQLFLEKGYEKTTTAEIARSVGMTPSSFFRSFDSKEDLLLELVRHMFDGQFAEAERLVAANCTGDPLLIYALEIAIQMHIIELSEPLRDLYLAAYSLPSTTAYICRAMTKKLQATFSRFMPQAQEQDFYELEIASGSITRGFMAVRCDADFPMESKLRRYLDCCLKLYDVPAALRRTAIEKTLETDLRTIARIIIAETVRRAEAGGLPASQSETLIIQEEQT